MIGKLNEKAIEIKIVKDPDIVLKDDIVIVNVVVLILPVLDLDIGIEESIENVVVEEEEDQDLEENPERDHLIIKIIIEIIIDINKVGEDQYQGLHLDQNQKIKEKNNIKN